MANVPEAADPADHTTRGIKTENNEKLWLSAPPILLLFQQEWVFQIPPSHETNFSKLSEDFDSFQFKMYSTWTRLLGVVARLYKAIQIIKDRAKTAISAAHYAKARSYLFRCSQTSSFTEQLEALQNVKLLVTRTNTFHLDPP